FQSLTNEEISAAMAHESGHLISRDNLKRPLLRACRDMLAIVPSGASLDRAWVEASEAAADEHAARGGSGGALDLASALIKIARLVPDGVKPAFPAGALLIGDDGAGGVDGAGIAERVRRLTRLATLEDVSPGMRTFNVWPWALFAAILISTI